MISSLNSTPCEPYEALREKLREHMIAALGLEPKGLVVAPCRVEGYHLYSNGGFFTRERDALLQNLPEEFEGTIEGGFVNVRVREEALRTAVRTLAQREPAMPERGVSSRMWALLSLRADEKDWGEAGCGLAWLLVRGESAGDYEKDLAEAFEVYFRQGSVDHDIIRAILARMGEKQ